MIEDLVLIDEEIAFLQAKLTACEGSPARATDCIREQLALFEQARRRLVSTPGKARRLP